MWTRRAFAGFSAAALATAAAAPASAQAPSRRAELESWRRFAETTHPRGLEAAADPAWRAACEDLAAKADGLSYSAFVVGMYRLAAWFKDGHTTFYASALERDAFALRSPVAMRAFYDGLYITKADAGHKALLGLRLEKAAGLPVAEVMQRFASIWPSNNPAWPHHDVGLLFATPGLLQGLGLIPGTEIPIEGVSATGARVRATLSPAPGPVTFEDMPRTRSPVGNWAQAFNGGNWVQPLPDKKTLYVSLDDLTVEVGAFVEFSRQVSKAMAEPGLRRVIFDLRRNGGGNNMLAEPLRREIARSSLNRPGGLYVLCGPTTFSAAQNVCNRLERETFAIFVGEPTGGAPNHYGDARHLHGEATGMAGGVSSLPWFDSAPFDHRPWIMPDVLAPLRFADWLAGRDLPLEQALADKTDAPADNYTRERVFYYDRPSQAQAWKPFWL